MVFLMTLGITGIVLFIDRNTLKRINARERKIYLTIILLFIVVNIAEQKNFHMDKTNPTEWIYNKLPFLKQFYSFLENKG